ncbi:AraC-type DNA-binding protein [Paenibacillus sp. BC26]|nr:AraC-type DNA-binding protein [Paenibacillus sp. BC26]
MGTFEAEVEVGEDEPQPVRSITISNASSGEKREKSMVWLVEERIGGRNPPRVDELTIEFLVDESGKAWALRRCSFGQRVRYNREMRVHSQNLKVGDAGENIMKHTYKTIIQNYFHRFQADVTIAAYSAPKNGQAMEQVSEFYRLWFIIEGEGELMQSGRLYRTKPGQLLLLPPGKQSFNTGSAPNAVYWCNFRASIGDMEIFDLLKLPIIVEPKEQVHLRALFERLIDVYRSSMITRELRIRAALFDIMAIYLEYGGISEESLQQVEPLEKIDRVLDYIEHNLSEQIGVDDLARLAYLHPNYFIGYFKNIVGYAPTQYVNMRRVERAKQLLEKPDCNISEVAQQVGMQNHYLSRMFKQYTGVTPSRYRQIYLSKKQKKS